MNIAAVRIILLSQGNQSLEAHMQAFLDLQHLVNYDDTSLRVFFRVGLNEKTRACLPGDEPLGSFSTPPQWFAIHNLRE